MNNEETPDTLDLYKIRKKLRLETHDVDFVDNHVMPVIQGLVEAMGHLYTAAKELAESHHALMMDAPDPGAAAGAAEFNITQALVRLEFRKPADWNYLNQFSATPTEIDYILRCGLSKEVYLNYQQEIGKRAVAEASRELYGLCEERMGNVGEGWIEAAQQIDPNEGGGPYPSEIIRLSHGPEEPQ